MSTLRTNEVAMLDDIGKAGFTFDSVEQMKDSTQIRVGQKVRTLGYYTPGDGGGNDYEIVSAGTGTDDGGSFIDLAGSGLQARGLFSQHVSILQFGAIGEDESVASDNKSAIENAINYHISKKLPLYFPGGKTYHTEAIARVGPYNVDIYSDGSKATLDLAVGERLMSFASDSEVTGLSLSSDVSPGERSIHLTDVSGLEEGMAIAISSNDNLWPYDPRGSYYNGEIHEITEVDSGNNSIRIKDYTRDSYSTTESMTIEAWHQNTLSIKNIDFNIRYVAGSTGGLSFTKAKSPIVENCSANGFGFYGFRNIFCIDCRYRNISFDTNGLDVPPGNGYGVTDRSSLGTIVDGLVSSRLRAAYDSHTNTSGSLSIPNRDAMVKNFWIVGGGTTWPDAAVNDTGTQGRGLGMHGPSDNIRFTDGHISNIYAAFRVRGKDTYISNVTLSGPMRRVVSGSLGAGLEITDCVYDSDFYPNRGSATPNELSLAEFATFAGWDHELPVLITGCTARGIRNWFCEFGSAKVENFYCDRNTIESVSDNTFYMMRSLHSPVVGRGSMIGNTVNAISGEFELLTGMGALGHHSHNLSNEAFQIDHRLWIMEISDDEVGYLQFPLTSRISRPNIVLAADAGGNAILRLRAESDELISYSGANTITSLSDPTVLNGTGGPDGGINIGLTSGGKFYLENRTGGTRTFRISYLG